MIRLDEMELFALCQIKREFVGGLEIMPGVNEPGAERRHRPVFLDAVAVRRDDRRLDAQARAGECDALPMIAGGRGDDTAQVRMRAPQLVEIDESAADLEGADRRVVLVLDPQLGPDPP